MGSQRVRDVCGVSNSNQGLTNENVPTGSDQMPTLGSVSHFPEWPARCLGELRKGNRKVVPPPNVGFQQVLFRAKPLNTEVSHSPGYY